MSLVISWCYEFVAILNMIVCVYSLVDYVHGTGDGAADHARSTAAAADVDDDNDGDDDDDAGRGGGGRGGGGGGGGDGGVDTYWWSQRQLKSWTVVYSLNGSQAMRAL